MRTLLAAVIGMSAIALSPTSAIAHHNTSHSIIVAGQDASCAHYRERPGALAAARQFAGSQRNPVTLAKDWRDPASHASGPCEATGVVAAVTEMTVALRHGPVASHRMPPMTMTFAIDDPQSLKDLAAGDRVCFDLKDRADTPTVNRIMKR